MAQRIRIYMENMVKYIGRAVSRSYWDIKFTTTDDLNEMATHKGI